MPRTLPALALIALAGAACAQRTESDVRAVYKQMSALFVKRDANGLVALFERSTTPDFTSIMANKKIGRAKTIADIRSGLKAKDFPTIETRVLSVRRASKAMIVAVLWIIDGRGADGKSYHLESNSTDTWVQTAKGYRLKQTLETTPAHPVKK